MAFCQCSLIVGLLLLNDTLAEGVACSLKLFSGNGQIFHSLHIPEKQLLALNFFWKKVRFP